MLGAKGVYFTVGPHKLEFMMPADPQSPLVDWIQTYGPSPYAATLRTARFEPVLFDLGVTHGANLSFGI